MVDEYYNSIIAHEDPVVMVPGESVFVFRLVTRLKTAGITAVAACSVRKVTERTTDNRRTKKQVSLWRIKEHDCEKRQKRCLVFYLDMMKMQY